MMPRSLPLDLASGIDRRHLALTHPFSPDLIAYRKFLGESYAKATSARMFFVAMHILQEYMYSGTLITNPAAGIKSFLLRW
jgi:hypothetical protein